MPYKYEKTMASHSALAIFASVNVAALQKVNDEASLHTVFAMADVSAG